MTHEQFLDKWVGHLAGLYARYAYGLETKLHERELVHRLEDAVGRMYHESRKDLAPINGAPLTKGKP